MEEVTNYFASEESFLVTNAGLGVENFTYLYTQDNYLTSSPVSTEEPYDDNKLVGASKLDLILGVAMVFLIIPTVIGNSLILVAFWKSRRLRTYFNYFICSMAFADLSVGAVNMPVYSIQFFSGRWPYGPKACLIFSIIDHVFVHVSVLSVVVIAIDRYTSLLNPLLHLRRKSLGRAIIMILPTYLIPIPLWTWFVLYRKQGRTANCYTGKRGEFPFNFVTPFILYIIPLIILASVCIAIYRIVRSRITKRSVANSKSISSSAIRDSSGTLNPSFSVADNNLCHSDLVGGLKAGNTATELKPEVKDSAGCSEEETAISRGLVKSPVNHDEKGASLRKTNEDGRVALDDVDAKIAVPKSFANVRHNSAMDLRASGGMKGVFTEDSSITKQSEESMKAVRTLTFIVLALVTSWSPWVLFVFIENICGNRCNVGSVYHVSFFWVYVNSLLNPFCYAAANRTFRRVIREFFRG